MRSSRHRSVGRAVVGLAFTSCLLGSIGLTAQSPWERVIDRPTERGRLAFDTQRSVLVYVGGGTFERATTSTPWVKKSSINPVSGDVVFDEVSGTTIGLEPSGATWAWDGSSWSMVATIGPNHTNSGVKLDFV